MFPPACDIPSRHIKKENTASFVLFPFSFSFGRKHLLFVCLPLGFDRELITSCDAVIQSVVQAQEASLPPKASMSTLLLHECF